VARPRHRGARREWTPTHPDWRCFIDSEWLPDLTDGTLTDPVALAEVDQLRAQHGEALEPYLEATRAVDDLRRGYAAEDAALAEDFNAEYTDSVAREATLTGAYNRQREAGQELIRVCDGIAQRVGELSGVWVGAIRASGLNARIERLSAELAAAKREQLAHERLRQYILRFAHRRPGFMLPWRHLRDMDGDAAAIAAAERQHMATAEALMPEPAPTEAHSMTPRAPTPSEAYEQIGGM
jgi:hypothetical protein